jgi:hypothetical protein
MNQWIDVLDNLEFLPLELQWAGLALRHGFPGLAPQEP